MDQNTQALVDDVETFGRDIEGVETNLQAATDRLEASKEEHKAAEKQRAEITAKLQEFMEVQEPLKVLTSFRRGVDLFGLI